jgi:very-short-patch-repair endonuclease
LLGLGLTGGGIEHRIARGRLHLIARGVYAVGRPTLTVNGRRMAAILASGGDLDRDGALQVPPGRLAAAAVALSHDSAAALLRIGPEPESRFEVSTTFGAGRRVPGVTLHRRLSLPPRSVGLCEGIPVTSPVQTLIDLAARHEQRTVERFVNEADRLRLVRTDDLRQALADHPGERGVGRLRAILDRRTFRYTRSELERAFLPLARQAGLPLPRTSVHVNGHEVDFHFPTLDLVIETDGLTYHRTPAQQAKDLERDQDHSASGTHTLRFSHAQIHYEPDRVLRTLRATATRLSGPDGTAIIPS